MADTPTNASSVPTAAKDSGTTEPANAVSKAAVQVDEPGKPVTAAAQAGKSDSDIEAESDGDYVLKEGHEHSAVVEGTLVQYVGGDTVRLTPGQFASFGDKFEKPGAKAKK